MKRARDIRDQFVGLLDRVEIDLVNNPHDHVNIRKVTSYIIYRVVLIIHTDLTYSVLFLVLK